MFSVIDDVFCWNSEWDLKPLSYENVTFQLDESKFVGGFEIKLNIQRKFEYYIWNFLMPSVALSLADCLSFILPAKSSEKLSMSVFVFLANGVLVRLFNENIPPISDEKSLFGILLWWTVLISGVVVILNTSITSLFHCKSPNCISPCCSSCTKCFKCKSCTHTSFCRNLICKTKEHTRSEHNLSTLSQAAETLPTEDESLIKHGDVSINIKGKGDTFIHHGSMKIQLGNLYNYINQMGPLSWADVTRNVDIVSCISIFVVYAVFYSAYLTMLVNRWIYYWSYV